MAEQSMTVSNPDAARLKHTFVHFTAKSPGDPLKNIFERIAVRVQAEGWHYQELALGHWPILDKPHEVANFLLDLA